MTPLTRIMFAFFMIALATIFTVSAQSINFSADNRYEGYKGPAIVWPSTVPDPFVCKALEYYEPSATNLEQFALQHETVRVQEHDECTWMITTSGWRWVLRRAGTKVAVDKEGRDLYDFGREDGKVCKNPRPFSIVVYIPPFTPARVVTPVPPPKEEVVIELPPYNPVRLVDMPPPPPPPPSFDYQVELVWDEHGKRWWWKYTPLFCVDVRRPKDLWRPALCAGVAVGGYALAGGFSGGAPLVKIPVRVPSIPVP